MAETPGNGCLKHLNYLKIMKDKTKTTIAKNVKNKAEVERRKSRMVEFLKSKTKKQRNRYLKSIADFETRKIDFEIEKFSKPGANVRYTWFRNREEAVKYYEEEKTMLPTIIYKAQIVGNKYFDDKLKYMADKLESFGFLEDEWNISDSNFEVAEGLGLNFWIEVAKHTGKISEGTFEREERRVYGRLVWVECYDKVSHYRFIVTNKKTNHHKQTA